MMISTFPVFSLQSLKKLDPEVLNFLVFQNGIFWSGFQLGVSNISCTCVFSKEYLFSLLYYFISNHGHVVILRGTSQMCGNFDVTVLTN